MNKKVLEKTVHNFQNKNKKFSPRLTPVAHNPKSHQHDPGCGPQSLNMTRPAIPDPILENLDADPLSLSNVGSFFKRLDKDNNGYLNVEEFCAFYTEMESFGTSVDQKSVRQKLSQMDAMRDGRVSYNEFCILMLQIVRR